MALTKKGTAKNLVQKLMYYNLLKKDNKKLTNKKSKRIWKLKSKFRKK